jgi:hypothetical protein
MPMLMLLCIHCTVVGAASGRKRRVMFPAGVWISNPSDMPPGMLDDESGVTMYSQGIWRAIFRRRPNESILF